MTARDASSGATCSGPLAACMGARVLLRGQARHNPPVPCVGPCRRTLVVIARWVVDAQHDAEGRPLGGHLCTHCDPWTPRSRAVVLEDERRRRP